MDGSTTQFISDSDLNDFSRKFKESLLELESKRKLFSENLEELQTVKSEKSFLQQELEKLQYEKKYIQKQLDEMKQISRQREEEWSNFRDNWAQNKIKFEISNKSSETFKNHISNQQNEISKLKAEKEELERQIRDNLVWKEKCLMTQKKVESTMDMLISQIRSLEQDHIRLDSMTKSAVIIANKAEQFRTMYENLLKQHEEENTALKKKVLELSMNLEECTLASKNNVTSLHNHSQDELMKTVNEWKEYQEENNNIVQQHFDNITDVYDSIAKLQASESEALKTIKKLEDELENEKLQNKRPDVQDFECQVAIPDNSLTVEKSAIPDNSLKVEESAIPDNSLKVEKSAIPGNSLKVEESTETTRPVKTTICCEKS